MNNTITKFDMVFLAYNKWTLLAVILVAGFSFGWIFQLIYPITYKIIYIVIGQLIGTVSYITWTNYWVDYLAKKAFLGLFESYDLVETEHGTELVPKKKWLEQLETKGLTHDEFLKEIK